MESRSAAQIQHDIQQLETCLLGRVQSKVELAIHIQNQRNSYEAMCIELLTTLRYIVNGFGYAWPGSERREAQEVIDKAEKLLQDPLDTAAEKAYNGSDAQTGVRED